MPCHILYNGYGDNATAVQVTAGTKVTELAYYRTSKADTVRTVVGLQSEIETLSAGIASKQAAV